ncbi:hypothetical protein ACRALDRAFT_1092809 [Sodiomyces alcalophilus JCM 7366]|uniref:uncharacterized protein n=1 Tax=Sodiomyces alcalophilus JCM 7366 TaxID=591952 RepID=UPI0039B53F57
MLLVLPCQPVTTYVSLHRSWLPSPRAGPLNCIILHYSTPRPYFCVIFYCTSQTAKCWFALAPDVLRQPAYSNLTQISSRLHRLDNFVSSLYHPPPSSPELRSLLTAHKMMTYRVSVTASICFAPPNCNRLLSTTTLPPPNLWSQMGRLLHVVRSSDATLLVLLLEFVLDRHIFAFSPPLHTSDSDMNRLVAHF